MQHVQVTAFPIGGKGSSAGVASHEDPLARFVGSSTPSVRVQEVIRMAAGFPSTVLIRGESGTGKELVARAMHQLSPRASQPFVTVDCTVLTQSLFESLMFGHEKGSFTGAVASTPGLVRSAHGGTLFLDEIGELPLPEQAKLLRLLQERSVMPVGGTKPVEVDIRLIAATHRDLAQMVANGQFRADLYYRLDVVQINIPSLRDRVEDIPLIARAILADLSQRLGVRRELSPGAERVLAAQPWPGNVRQMAACLERAAVLCGAEVIQPAHLDMRDPVGLMPAQPAARGSLTMATVLKAIEACGGNRSEAARSLGICRAQLYRLLQRHAAGHSGEPAASGRRSVAV